MAYRYGFKAEAERLALETRRELGLGAYERLDPWTLADHLGIPVRSMSNLVEGSNDLELAQAVTVLAGPEREAVSALTVLRGTVRCVVYNDAHDPGRIANSVTHECCHGLLLHPAAPALDQRGCRNWNADLENEANFLAGALLIPAKAAWWIAKRKLPFAVAAQEYGCSQDVVRWRVNITGAGRLLAG